MKQILKLAQRQVVSNHHDIHISLIGNTGCISITDNGLYPDDDSRTHKRDMGHNTMIIPRMTREELTELHNAIGEVLNTYK
jgi:hypothetical protein